MSAQPETDPLGEVSAAAARARELRHQADQAQTHYLAAVRAARDAGHPMTVIAHVSGITRAALYKSLRKREPKPVEINE